MKIKHFGEIEFAESIPELLEILHKRYGDDTVDEYYIFYTNSPEEQIENSRDAVVSVKKAYDVAQKFFDTHEMPDNIEWTEN